MLGGSTTTTGNGFGFQTLAMIGAVDGFTSAQIETVLAERAT